MSASAFHSLPQATQLKGFAGLGTGRKALRSRVSCGVEPAGVTRRGELSPLSPQIWEGVTGKTGHAPCPHGSRPAGGTRAPRLGNSANPDFREL